MMSLWNVVIVLPLLFISIKAYPILRSEEEVSWLHKEWQVNFDKTYENPLEREKRFEIFKDNLLFIDQHNDPRNNHSYTLGLNSLADLTFEEYQSRYISPMQEGNIDGIEVEEKKDIDLEQLPAFVDWRLQGSVSPVVDQHICYSCWAWAVTGAIESFHHIQTGEMIILSAQQLVDCAKNVDCTGGNLYTAFNYIKENGIDSLENYPYTHQMGVCRKDAGKVMTINGYRMTFMNDISLQEAVAKQPVAVSMDAKKRDIQMYYRGVYDGQCTKYTNHAVLIVGYGTENGLDYWLAKNCWGFNWGDHGYMKIRRNVRPNSKCGIALDAKYPY